MASRAGITGSGKSPSAGMISIVAMARVVQGWQVAAEQVASTENWRGLGWQVTPERVGGWVASRVDPSRTGTQRYVAL